MKHYLDYNATAPLRPQVRAVMLELLAEPLNPSSVHAAGRRAKAVLEDARRSIAETIGVFPTEIIFPASGTEANNWVLQAFAGYELLLSATEHSSLLKPAKNARRIPVLSSGLIDMQALEKLLHDARPPFLVSVMLANNETGVIQPVRIIADMVHAKGGLLHCDAAQALGKIAVDFNDLGCDLLTLAAHKMGGPVGVAALVAKSTLPLTPMLNGGAQEINRRAGTENVAAIAGFAAAVQLIDLAAMAQLREWLNALEAALVAQGAQIAGQGAPRLPNTSCIIMPGVSAETQLIRYDLAGIAVSAGSACSSGRVEPSSVLAAMGIEEALAASAIRVSGGWQTSHEDIDAFRLAWSTCREARKRTG